MITIIIKAFFMFFTGIYAISKIMNAVEDKYLINTKDRVVNIVEIVVGIFLTFAIYKI